MLVNKLLFKIAWVVLIYFLIIMQYKILVGDESIFMYLKTKNDIALQLEKNKIQENINSSLSAEVANLKNGFAAIEERARTDLGMIRDGEHYYQIIE